MRNILRYASLAAAAQLAAAVSLDVTSKDSIKNATSLIAHGMLSYYTGNVTDTASTVGVLPGPYYWWESGAMWGSMLDYYHYTGDTSYNAVVTQALLSQVGPDYDYMVPAHQKDEGNDDQAFWGFATMSAAEKNYPQPTVGNYSWVQLTENLWNTQVRRWDTSSCDGGLKWQIFTFNNGYDYKNSVSNGAFFQLSARLARFTGNQTYMDWAIKSYDWLFDVGLISSDYHVYDGADDTQNCSTPNKIIWTYNGAIMLYGSAVLYNYTNGSSLWQERTQGFLNATANFFSPYDNATNIMYEPACEPVNTCDNDQYSFKAYLSRFMWASTLMAPFTGNAITTLLTDSSKAAAQSCSGPSDGVTCGEHWYWGEYDGYYGVGQQMSALETIQGLLVSDSVPPLHSGQVSLMTTPTTSTTVAPAPVPTMTATATPTKRGLGEKNEPSSLIFTVIASMSIMMVRLGLGELVFGAQI
ncbi:Mannan endo-1,6-alpha-mannosidase DCW1 [Lachnellula suecica]|uniref:Mannan endo-1,6-alpha-mannosidase n=1 Tax=Lachnellula suecica TaxID=602035 RepID=A0A8T9C7X3_9HELO|nr:Mannan endo-1,6-alpha-mannosidase DCW1 [Lachnellula suecica]